MKVKDQKKAVFAWEKARVAKLIETRLQMNEEGTTAIDLNERKERRSKSLTEQLDLRARPHHVSTAPIKSMPVA